MISPFTRSYVIRGIAGTPAVLHHLLEGLDSQSEVWDFRPEPERFSLREVLAHLADFDEITAGRFQRILTEDTPELPNWDEDAAVLTGNYAATNPLQKLAQLTASRQEITALLATVAEGDWARSGVRSQLGVFTLEEAVTLMMAHDSYHIQQIVEWLEKFGNRSI